MKRPKIPELSSDERRFFRDEFRNARATALRDSEGFHAIVAALERLGAMIAPADLGLGKLKGKLLAIADQAPSAPRSGQERHLGPLLDDLYDLIRVGRNDAVHHGAYARHLARRCIQLALYVEDGLMAAANCVADFMVREPAIAEVWQPVAVARQRMLAESFSNLPIRVGERWHFLTDHAMASYLSSQADRQAAMRRRIQNAVDQGQLQLVPAAVVKPSTPVATAISESKGNPVLVVEKKALIGIATPFDFL